MTRRTRSAAPTSRRRRLVGALALSPIAALTLAGCQWTSTIQTDKAYEPADGKSVHFGNVGVSNLMVVTDKKDGQGTILGTGTNDTAKPATIKLGVQGAQTITLEVPAYGSKKLSEPSGTSATIPSVPVAPGGLLDVQIAGPDGGSQTVQIPVVAPYGQYGDYSTSGPITPSPAPATSSSSGGH